MSNLKKLTELQALRAESEQPKPAAFATEIRSNADVVGNKLSKFMYNQEPVIDEGLAKMANSNNRYLEKIAGAKTWLKALKTEFQNAGPLEQFKVSGRLLGTGTVGLGVGLAQHQTNAKMELERSKREANSLKALKGINKTLSTAVISPSSVEVKKNKG